MIITIILNSFLHRHPISNGIMIMMVVILRKLGGAVSEKSISITVIDSHKMAIYE